ncbi:MAG: hypothetical protein Q4E59_07640, partial [Bacteroidales bacterium]|nr:hypothetical protein [Bacteroidales bacterium]
MTIFPDFVGRTSAAAAWLKLRSAKSKNSLGFCEFGVGFKEDARQSRQKLVLGFWVKSSGLISK